MATFDTYKDRYETIKLERTEDGILQMTLHSQGGSYVWDARQGSATSHEEMGDALHEISRDRENLIVIMTGTGEEFSGPPANRGTMSRGDTRHWHDVQDHGTKMILDLLDIQGLVISCINGPAYRHAELPLTADIVLAADDALIQDSAHFPNRMVPGDGIALIVPHLIGWNRGRYFHLTNQKIGAAEMKELGLVNEVMPRDELLPRAWELARELIQNNPMVLRNTRTVFTAPMKALLHQYLDYGLALEAVAAVDETIHNPL
jgi:enoyl-CoA hydratase/carnithine racemase